MSRFDLFFVIYDEKSPDRDQKIAEHIVNMHRLNADRNEIVYSKDKLQNYIKIARQLRPQFMKESALILKEKYKEMRQSMQGQDQKSAYRYTVRQLESLVRLSEAMARLYCDDKIRPSYVTEVCRLLQASNINIIQEDIEMEGNQEALEKDRLAKIAEEEERERKVQQAAANDLFVSFLDFS